jgi:hypothetical protein
MAATLTATIDMTLLSRQRIAILFLLSFLAMC